MEGENKAQKLAGRIFIISFSVLAISICIGLYFDKNYTIDPDTNNLYYSGLYIVKEKTSYQGHNSYYEDVWTGQKYASSGSRYEVYNFKGINKWYDVNNIFFNTVNFNLNDTVYLYYRAVYTHKRKDSTYIATYADSSITINEARKRNIKLSLY